ncbi:MAG: hypothetical protein AAGA57_01810 [Planctomycetota bacterium]
MADGKAVRAEVEASSEASLLRRAERSGLDVSTLEYAPVDSAGGVVLADPPADPYGSLRPNQPVVVSPPLPASPASPPPAYASPPPGYAPAPPAQQMVNNVVVQVSGGDAGKGGLVYAVASFFVPGLGQLLKGQPVNGVLWFVLTVIGYMLVIIPGILMHLCCVIGAAMPAKSKGPANQAVIAQ